jgi:hypothetical protein
MEKKRLLLLNVNGIKMERLIIWLEQQKEIYGEELAQAETNEEKWAYAEVLGIIDQVSGFLEEAQGRVS